MTKIIISSVFAILFSAVNALAFVDPDNVVDPEKEQAKNKKASVYERNEDNDRFIQKGFHIKDQLINPIKEDSVKKEEIKEEKPKEATAEDVQSFNFLYYILQSKFSDFITY